MGGRKILEGGKYTTGVAGSLLETDFKWVVQKPNLRCLKPKEILEAKA